MSLLPDGGRARRLAWLIRFSAEAAEPAFRLPTCAGSPPYRSTAARIAWKTTAKRIYIDGSDPSPYGETKLCFIDRRELEEDTRCPGPTRLSGERQCVHGRWYSHGYAAGEIWYHGSAHWSRHDLAHLFTTREAAEADLYGRKAVSVEDVKALRQAMADAHPDRGGNRDEFMAARERYQKALRQQKAAS